MGVQAQAAVLVARGRVADGLDLLDDAMCSAMAGELSSFFTGWVYCLGLQQCMACADLGRAAEWTDAAMKWCASMPAENNFRGLCRVHRVQVLELRGRWTRAVAEAAQGRQWWPWLLAALVWLVLSGLVSVAVTNHFDEHR